MELWALSLVIVILENLDNLSGIEENTVIPS